MRRHHGVHTLAVEAADNGLLALRGGIEELIEALLTAVQQRRRIVFSFDAVPSTAGCNLIVFACQLSANLPDWELGGMHIRVSNAPANYLQRRREITRVYILCGGSYDTGGSDCPRHRAAIGWTRRRTYRSIAEIRTQKEHNAGAHARLTKMNMSLRYRG